MQIIRASAMGMCFGVRDALRHTRRLAQPAAITIHGQLVHNPAVMRALEARGFHAQPETQRDTLPETPAVLITAHGTSDAQRRRLQEAGKQVIDTTCPLVTKAHKAALALRDQGYHVLVIGQPGHVEVLGLTGDLPSFDVIASPDQVRRYPHEHLGIICQTTSAAEDVARIKSAIIACNPEAQIRFIDTVCQPTKERQSALEVLLQQVHALVVVGGHNSNNTRKLIETARRRGVMAFHVQDASELEARWFAGVTRVGLTAGTSTLEETIDEVHTALLAIAARLPGSIAC